jgi:hypothetical protein
VLLYCHRLLTIDSLREHVFAFVTDFTQCRLVKVKRRLVEEVAGQGVREDTVSMSSFPWYNESNGELTGLRALYSLGQLTYEELGMGLMHLFTQPVELLRNLGTGSSADVYLIKSDDGRNAVLKVAKKSTEGKSQLDNEAATLKTLYQLDGPADGAEWRQTRAGMALTSAAAEAASDDVPVRDMLKHIPHRLDFKDGVLSRLQLRPKADSALYLNFNRKHVVEFITLLRWLHRRGWFHRDISHHNIMLADEDWQSPSKNGEWQLAYGAQ